MLAPAEIEGQLPVFGLHAARLGSRWRDEIERVLLPMPLARLVQGIHVTDDHASSFLGLVAARISSGKPPGVGAVADADRARLGAFDDAGLPAPAFVVDAVVDCPFPVIGGLPFQKPARHAARLPSRIGNGELAEGGPQRREIGHVHFQSRGRPVGKTGLDHHLAVGKDLVAPQPERPGHGRLPDVSLVTRPAGDRIAPAHHDLLALIRLDHQRPSRLAAPWKGNRLTIHAAAQQQGVAGPESVDARLDSLQCLTVTGSEPGVRVVPLGRDKQGGSGRRVAAENESEDLGGSGHGRGFVQDVCNRLRSYRFAGRTASNDRGPARHVTVRSLRQPIRLSLYHDLAMLAIKGAYPAM